MDGIKVYYYSDLLNFDHKLKVEVEDAFGKVSSEESDRGAVGVGGGVGEILQVGVYVLIAYPLLRFVDGFFSAAGEDMWSGFKKLYRLATKTKNRKQNKPLLKNSATFFINMNFQDTHINLSFPVEEEFDYEVALDRLYKYIRNNARNMNSSGVVSLRYSDGEWTIRDKH